MRKKFASIELARIYETQGYFQDALSMYMSLDDDVLKGGAEIRAAVRRVETALAKAEANGACAPPLPGEAEKVAQTLAELNEFEFEGKDAGSVSRSEPEQRVADLIEKWLTLVVAQRRLGFLKEIKAEL